MFLVTGVPLQLSLYPDSGRERERRKKSWETIKVQKKPPPYELQCTVQSAKVTETLEMLEKT